METTKTIRKVLSIDGGGIRGLVPALILAEIEARTGKSIASSFDLIGGTSTGGILALGLSKNDGSGKPAYSALTLAEIYQKRGSEIFSRTWKTDIKTLWGIAGETYSAKGLEKLLNEYYGDDPLSSCVTNTFVTTYDIQNREPIFLKSWKTEHRSVQMKHAARATSAAPTFFEPALVPIGGSMKALVDGAVYVNTPSVSVYAEAKRLFPNDEIVVVSLGTGELVRPIAYDSAKGWGKAGWALPILGCVFDGSSDAANYQMTMLLGDNYTRLQTELSIASDDMDNVTPENIQKLEQEVKKLLRTNEGAMEKVIQALAR
jgi:uncharacterized protein